MALSLARKIFLEHVVDQPFKGMYALRTDLVVCHEITTPPAILDNQSRWGDRVFDTSKIVALIDHVSPAKDSATALQEKVMRDWAKRLGIRFFDVGNNGVCHALIPEQGLILPGMTAICGDSHTCTYGAMGALSWGVGTTDLQAALLKGIAFLPEPKVMAIRLKGELQNGVYAKDVILFIISKLGVKGATGFIVEYLGPVIDNMNQEERLTVCNMTVEMGGTSGLCRPDNRTFEYLCVNPPQSPTSLWGTMEAKWQPDPGAVYDREIELDLTSLEPQVTYGNDPSEVKSVGEMAGTKVDQVYIGSCTNGRLSDLRIAAKILKGKKVAKNVRLIVAPATTKVQLDAISDGLAEDLINAGACFTNPTCGACLGMSCGVLAEGEVCASTTNRNFPGRMGKGGRVLLMSPATAAVTALNGVVMDPREVL